MTSMTEFDCEEEELMQSLMKIQGPIELKTKRIDYVGLSLRSRNLYEGYNRYVA